MEKWHVRARIERIEQMTWHYFVCKVIWEIHVILTHPTPPPPSYDMYSQFQTQLNQLKDPIIVVKY